MKGAEAYVNDQWQRCGLATLPQGPDSHRVTLNFIVPRDVQFTGLLNHIRAVALQRLGEAYPGREISPDPVIGSVVGDGSGDGINLVYHIGPAV